MNLSLSGKSNKCVAWRRKFYTAKVCAFNKFQKFTFFKFWFPNWLSMLFRISKHLWKIRRTLNSDQTLIKLVHILTILLKWFQIVWNLDAKMSTQLITLKAFLYTTFSTIPPFGKDEDDVSYDVKPLFLNIPVKETIDYIIDQINVQKKLTPICTKIVFERLLCKVATECKFTFSLSFY